MRKVRANLGAGGPAEGDAPRLLHPAAAGEEPGGGAARAAGVCRAAPRRAAALPRTAGRPPHHLPLRGVKINMKWLDALVMPGALSWRQDIERVIRAWVNLYPRV